MYHVTGRLETTLPRARQGRLNETLKKQEQIVWPYILLLPIMNLMVVGVKFECWLSEVFQREFGFTNWVAESLTATGRQVRDNATSSEALELIYHFQEGSGPNAFLRWTDWILMHVRNTQAPRNRLLLATQTLSDSIETRFQENGRQPVAIVSLASGSAQGVIETAARKQLVHSIPQRLVLIDKNAKALNRAEILANELGIGHLLTTCEGDIVRFPRILQGEGMQSGEVDIFDLMGIFDYLTDRSANWLLSHIYQYLRPGGLCYASNVHDNPEREFVEHVVQWGKMHYRTTDEFKALFEGAGFENVRVTTEFHGIQSFAVGRKKSR